jgi:Mn-dependent DtxR family transcriptional regulator
MSGSTDQGNTGEYVPSVTVRLLEQITAAQGGTTTEYVTSTYALAAILGSSRRQVQRVIGRLEKRGIVQRDYVTTETGRPIGTRLRRVTTVDSTGIASGGDRP